MPAPPKTYRFTVTGYDTFPVDMLRYDRCWPQTERDSGQVSPSGNRVFPKRTIHMEGLKLPTTARWASFGWEATTA